MIRQALISDLNKVENGYNEHFEYEKNHVAYTVLKKGIYPTKKTAENAIKNGTLYVYEENDDILGSIIAVTEQPKEYKNIEWLSQAENEKVIVIHLLMVRPDASGKGIGSALINYVTETAKQNAFTSVRLDTGAQNIPALTLYKKLGFQVAAISSMKVGGAISHKDHVFLEKVLN